MESGIAYEYKKWKCKSIWKAANENSCFAFNGNPMQTNFSQPSVRMSSNHLYSIINVSQVENVTKPLCVHKWVSNFWRRLNATKLAFFRFFGQNYTPIEPKGSHTAKKSHILDNGNSYDKIILLSIKMKNTRIYIPFNRKYLAFESFSIGSKVHSCILFAVYFTYLNNTIAFSGRVGMVFGSAFAHLHVAQLEFQSRSPSGSQSQSSDCRI